MLKLLHVQDGKVQKGLKAKLGSKRTRSDHEGKVDSQILSPILEALLVDEFHSTLSEELPYHQYGSPFLQTVLLAAQGNE